MKYRRVNTGKIVNVSPGYVAAFPPGTYELVETGEPTEVKAEPEPKAEPTKARTKPSKKNESEHV